MTDELRDNAKQHGVGVADYVARKIQTEGMSPERAAELLQAYIARRAESMTKQGASRQLLTAWIQALESAFDARLAELVGEAEAMKRPGSSSAPRSSR